AGTRSLPWARDQHKTDRGGWAEDRAVSSDLSAPPAAPTTLTDDAVRLAHRWLDATAADETPRERRTTGRLAALVSDPAGLEFAVRFVDRVARPDDVRVAAADLARLGQDAAAARAFLGPVDRTLLAVGVRVAPLLPALV